MKKLDLDKLTCMMYVTFPIINLFLHAIFPEGIRHNISRIYIILAILFGLIYLFKNKIKGFIISLLLIFLNVFYTYIKLSSFVQIGNFDILGFYLLIVALMLFTEEEIINIFKEYINKNSKIIKYNTFFTILLCILSIILGIGFVQARRTVVFKGFFNIEHTLAYHLIVSYALLLCDKKINRENNHFISKIFITIFLILTGVRSAFFAYIILLIYDFNNMNKSIKFIYILILFMGGIFIFSNNNIISKIPIISKTNAAERAGDITNGRGDLTYYGLNYYNNRTTKIEKYFGITMYNLRKVYWNGLHAHNDFVNVLLGYGLLYLAVIAFNLLKLLKINNGLIVLLILLILGLFNGLFIYYEMTISIPILINAFSDIDKGRKIIRWQKKKYL